MVVTGLGDIGPGANIKIYANYFFHLRTFRVSMHLLNHNERDRERSKYGSGQIYNICVSYSI